MLLALLVGVPCQSLAPTAGKSEPLRQLPEVSSGAEVEAAQPLVVEHSCLLLQPLPAHPHKAPGQRSNTITSTQTESHIYSFCNTFVHSHQPLQLDQEVSQEKHLDGAILICTVSPVGKLLTRVFPPCPNSIANLFSPSACFHLIQKNKSVSVWLLLCHYEREKHPFVPMSERFCTYSSFLLDRWFIFGNWLGPYLASWLP